MSNSQLIMMAMGVFATLVMLILATSGPATGKAQNRRVQEIRDRHQPSAALAIENQLRKISSNKASSLDLFAQRFIPNPAVLRARLDKTGLDWKLGKFMAISCGIALGFTIILTVIRVPFLLALLVGIVIGLGGPHMLVSKLITRRVAKFNANFPDAIELMVRGLRSGLPISETLGVVGRELAGPIGLEFRQVNDRIRIGRTMEVALQEMADRIATPEAQFFCITLAIQRETGGNLAETLSNLSEVLRKRASMRLKIKAMSSESKASAYIIGVLPFGVFGLIYSVNPAYMTKFFTDTRLMMLGGGGMVWMAIGAFIMSKMINFEI